jgi:hypothetical protein
MAMARWFDAVFNRSAKAGPAPASALGEAPPTEAGHAAELEAFRAARHEHRMFISEYPYDLRSRPFETSHAGRRILDLCGRAAPESAAWLDAIHAHAGTFREIPRGAPADDSAPFWENGMIPALDGMMLYALIRRLKPKTYLEVGSGNSTKFVRKAIADGALKTQLVSIDPHPRAGIDRLCDEVIRQPFETVPEDQLRGRLQANDVVFIDNSHRSFPNSDVTVFFTETLSWLPPGVCYGIHDICLPFDYPQVWMERFYNEQYLLAAYLLGGGDGDEVIFPGTHIVSTPAFVPALKTIMKDSGLAYPGTNAGAFWMRRGARAG